MKKTLDFIVMICSACALFINLVTIARGQQISQLTIILATICCLLYSIEKVIDDTLSKTKQD